TSNDFRSRPLSPTGDVTDRSRTPVSATTRGSPPTRRPAARTPLPLHRSRRRPPPRSPQPACHPQRVP
uniref:Uncharacterized protein n=1 Tax=Triticum urartu TaxID=4572 RepID=A0A8R7Q9R0_TRIUA